MDAIRELLVANGSEVDLETSVYYSDHGIQLREALELARAARADRPGIYGDDALAWALTRNRRCREALPYSEALRCASERAMRTSSSIAAWSSGASGMRTPPEHGSRRRST